MDGANSTEFDIETEWPVIDLLPEQKEVSDLGGTMRLGADPVKLHEGTRAQKIYGEAVIYERHRHRYEVSISLRKKLEHAGLVVSGTSPDERLVEAVEPSPITRSSSQRSSTRVPSRPERPAPLFYGFVEARGRKNGGAAGQRVPSRSKVSDSSAARWPECARRQTWSASALWNDLFAQVCAIPSSVSRNERAVADRVTSRVDRARARGHRG